MSGEARQTTAPASGNYAFQLASGQPAGLRHKPRDEDIVDVQVRRPQSLSQQAIGGQRSQHVAAATQKAAEEWVDDDDRWSIWYYRG